MAFQHINGFLFMNHFDFGTALGDNHDVASDSTCIAAVPTNNNDAITGVVTPIATTGCLLWILNGHATNNLVLKHNTGSSAGNRFLFASGSDLTLEPFKMIQFLFMDQVGREGWWSYASPISLATTSSAGSMSAADKVKLDALDSIKALKLLNQTFTVPVLGLAAETISTFAVPGAVVGYGVMVNPTAAATSAQRAFHPFIYSWVSAANTVSVAYRTLLSANLSSTACPIDIHVIPHP